MQFYAAILALAALASAQDYSKLPACARDCFINNFPKSGCSAPTDLVCVCKYVVPSTTFFLFITLRFFLVVCVTRN